MYRIFTKIVNNFYLPSSWTFIFLCGPSYSHSFLNGWAPTMYKSRFNILLFFSLKTPLSKKYYFLYQPRIQYSWSLSAVSRESVNIALSLANEIFACSNSCLGEFTGSPGNGEKLETWFVHPERDHNIFFRRREIGDALSDRVKYAPIDCSISCVSLAISRLNASQNKSQVSTDCFSSVT